MFQRRLNRVVTILWNITYGCNLNCKHCLLGLLSEDLKGPAGKEQPLSANDTVVLLSNACSEGVQIKEFNFQGGEPTVAPNFLTAVEWLGEHRIPWTVNTNATVWDQRHYSLVEEYPPLSITISLDGADSALHDWVRGQGAFAKLVETVRSLHDLSRGAIPIDAICVLNKRNVKEVTAVLDTAVSLGIREIVLARLTIAGNAILNQSELEPEPRELFEVLKFVCLHKGRYRGLTIYVSWATPIMIEYYNKRYGTDVPISYSGCPAIRSEVTVSPQGFVWPCPNALNRLAVRFGEEAFPLQSDELSLLSNDLTRIRNSKLFQKVYELLHGSSRPSRLARCQICKFASICQTCPSERWIGDDSSARLCHIFQDFFYVDCR